MTVALVPLPPGPFPKLAQFALKCLRGLTLVVAALQPALAGAQPNAELEFVLFDAPGAVDTSPTSINDRGVIVGNALMGAEPGRWRVFVRRPDGSFNFLDDLEGLGTDETEGGSTLTVSASGINNAGVIVGWYQIFDDDDNFIHQAGFVRFPNGRYVEVDASLLWDINDRGDIVGTGGGEEFFRPAFGSPIPLDPPGCQEPGCLRALNFGISVNDRRQIVGKLRDDTGLHGYLVRFPHRFHGRLHRH